MYSKNALPTEVLEYLYLECTVYVNTTLYVVPENPVVARGPYPASIIIIDNMKMYMHICSSGLDWFENVGFNRRL